MFFQILDFIHQLNGFGLFFDLFWHWEPAILKVIPLKLFLVTTSSEIPAVCRNNQSYDPEFAHGDSSICFTSIFFSLENINATHVIIMSAEELGTMSKYSGRGITLGISYVSLYPLVNFFIHVHAIGLSCICIHFFSRYSGKTSYRRCYRYSGKHL